MQPQNDACDVNIVILDRVPNVGVTTVSQAD